MCACGAPKRSAQHIYCHTCAEQRTRERDRTRLRRLPKTYAFRCSEDFIDLARTTKDRQGITTSELMRRALHHYVQSLDEDGTQ